MPFLTLLDDRAKPKGSRDPLGFELVWSDFGRKVIGNFTTITSSLTNFSVALLGFHWSNELSVEADEMERHQAIRERFLRFEQMAAYLRYLDKDQEIMGINRVSRRIQEDQPVAFGLAGDRVILSDQASYGLWGLYSAAMRSTQLVDDRDRVPTELGLRVAREIESKLSDKSALINLYLSNKPVSLDKLRPYASSFNKAIKKDKVRIELLDCLMRGDPAKPLQKELWGITRRIGKDKVPERPVAFISAVKRMSPTDVLTQALTYIERVERLLVCCNNLFHFCRRKDDVPIDDVVDSIKHLEYEFLSMDCPLAHVHRGDRLEVIRRALINQDHRSALESILELNKSVMKDRDGAPWVELEGDGKLRVRVVNEVAELKTQQQIENDWDYEYFLSSFLQIAKNSM